MSKKLVWKDVKHIERIDVADDPHELYKGVVPRDLVDGDTFEDHSNVLNVVVSFKQTGSGKQVVTRKV